MEGDQDQDITIRNSTPGEWNSDIVHKLLSEDYILVDIECLHKSACILQGFDGTESYDEFSDASPKYSEIQFEPN